MYVIECVSLHYYLVLVFVALLVSDLHVEGRMTSLFIIQALPLDLEKKSRSVSPSSQALVA